MYSLKKIKLLNFRNYSSAKFDDLKKVNIFVGPNAVGKTNLMEAVSLVTQLSSFRHPVLADMLPFSCSDGGHSDASAKIEAQFDDGYSLSAVISTDSKTYKFNGKKKGMGELKGRYPAVVFTPDDLMLVKGGNSLRRNSLDALGSQISQNYYTVVRDYNRIMRQKRECLRDAADKNTLVAINSVMALPAAQLVCFRAALSASLSEMLSENYDQIADSDEQLQLVYKSELSESNNDNEWKRDEIQQNFVSTLERIAEKEIAAGRALVGPHRDLLDFVLVERNAASAECQARNAADFASQGQVLVGAACTNHARNAADFASQGQQRSIVLAWKLAEVQMIQQRLGRTPILLLDDVMSELDRNRRHALLNSLNNSSQVFITTTNLDYFEPEFLNDANVINLAN